MTCTIGSLPNGGTAVVTLVARATQPGTLVNRSTVTEKEADTNLANNASQATVTAQGPFTPPASAKAPKQKSAHAVEAQRKAVVKKGKQPTFTG